jgi:3-deoxy-D-manno-octulosonate 8-phosphate phosphatase (KDO 8-P phosphatase)
MDGLVTTDAAPALRPAPVLLARALRLRAAQVRLVVTDVDGVLTDGGVYYSDRGESMKRFNVRDGMGVERLRLAGIETAFLTRETSAIVVRRAEKLGLRLCYLGVHDKLGALPRILGDAQLELPQLAFIGDDVNDAPLMAEVAARGLSGTPADATPSLLPLAHHRCQQPGGHGAFREFAEWILGLRAEAAAPAAGDGGAITGNTGKTDITDIGGQR